MRLCAGCVSQVSGIPAGVGAAEVQALLADTAGLYVDRLDLTTPEGPANRDNLQVRCGAPWGEGLGCRGVKTCWEWGFLGGQGGGGLGCWVFLRPDLQGECWSLRLPAS